MDDEQKGIETKEKNVDASKRKSLFRFREWPVYQAAKSFRKKIRELASKLPEKEKYLIRGQISRAADSIGLNIAEGSNKLSDVDFSRYLNNAETSLEEVVACLDLILDDGHISKEEFDGFLTEAENLGAQLIAFGKKVRQQGSRL